MKISIRLIALILVALMLFVSCAESTDKIQTESAVDTGTVDSALATEPDPLTLLNTKDYEGYEFNVLTLNAGINNTTRFVDEIWVEGENGEIINDAVYKRNLAILDKMNVEILAVPVSDPYNTARAAILADDNVYAMIDAYKADSVSLATQKLLRNWNDLPAVDFNQPWWNQHCRDNLTVGGNLYMMSGSILISEIDDTLAMVFNKALAVDYKTPDIYELVRNNQWTLDKFCEIVTAISSDLNGDGKLKVGDDLYGYVQDPASMTNNWCFSCGLLKGKVDEDGVWNMNVDTDRVQTTLQKLAAVFKSDAAKSGTDLYEGLTYFEENKIFAYAIILRNVELLRDMKIDFGIIPYPMFDEAQGEYLTHVGNASPIMTIPLTNGEDDERLGTILEAMAISSYQIVTPAYYDTALKDKYSRDPESAEMLDIVLAARTYDIGYVGGYGLVGTIAGLITGKKTEFASSWAKNEVKQTEAFQKYIDMYLEG
jgi:hypothetical protein